MGFSESFSKVILIIFNIIFFIVGGIILGIGIWMKVAKSSLFDFMKQIKLDGTGFDNSTTSFIDIVAIILIIVGTFTFITGFCGCCGAMRESKCLLYMYSFLVGAIVLIELGIGIYAGVEKDKFQNHLEKSVLSVFRKNFVGVLNKNADPFTKVFTGVMFELQCCGVHNQSDFNTVIPKWKQEIEGTTQVNPVGCCKLKPKSSYAYDGKSQLTYDEIKKELADPNCPIKQKTYLNSQGCVQSLMDFIKNKSGIIIGVCVGIGLFEILCIVFACCVARQDE